MGPLGELAGEDLGFELAFGLAAGSYVVLRAVERSRFKM